MVVDLFDELCIFSDRMDAIVDVLRLFAKLSECFSRAHSDARVNDQSTDSHANLGSKMDHCPLTTSDIRGSRLTDCHTLVAVHTTSLCMYICVRCPLLWAGLGPALLRQRM